MKSKFFGLAAICFLLLGVLIGNAATASASSNVHGGNWTMVATLSGTPTYKGPNQNVTLEAGKTYQYTAWIRGAGTIALVLQKGDWSGAIVYKQFTASADWQQITATYTVPAGGSGAYHAQIQDAYQGSSPATLYIDDVFFGETSGSNLLANGDFELGSSNTAWSDVKTPYAIVYYPVYVHGGNWTMVATLSGTPTYKGPNQNVTLEAGKTYQYTAWIRGAGTIALVLQKGDWSNAIVYKQFTASADWQQITATYTEPAGGSGAYHAQIQDAYQGSTPATLYIDDVFFGVASGSNLLANGGFELGSNGAWSDVKTPYAIVNYPSYRSGLPWSSGAFKSGATNDPTKMNDFENWRGRLVDTATDFTYRTTWSQITNSSQVAAWDGKPYRLVLAVPFFPEDGTSNFAACAAGSYNSYWNTFGTNLVSHHEGNAIIRLGWEFNGDWYPNHEVTTTNLNDGTWVGCFKKVVASIRQTAPNIKIDWNVSRGDGLKAVGDGKGDPAQVYPGDSYVDYIGIDEYDMWEPALTQSAWDTYHMGGAYGIQHWIDFATSHGKQVSFPEWGLNHGDSHHGNDNPYFIQKMWSLFNSLSSSGKLAYEGYYDEGPGGINAALDVAGLNPNSAPVYQSNW